MEKTQHGKCLVCKEIIIYDAKKCTKCDSFQDWRRYFQFNAVVLSLLVALLSVITVSAPVIKSVLLPEADARFSFLHFNDKKIVVVATNTGNRAAVLKEAWLNMEDINDAKPRTVSLAVRGESGKKEIILKPDKWAVLPLSPVETSDSFNLFEPIDYRSCRLDFLTLDLNHEQQSISIDVACDEVLGKHDG